MPTERLLMRQIREILRLRWAGGLPQRAVARHLAEATYWMLTRQQPYREPLDPRPPVSSTEA